MVAEPNPEPGTSTPNPLRRAWRTWKELLPQIGLAGSRSANLHTDGEYGVIIPRFRLRETLQLKLQLAVALGSIGTILITIGGLGAGAMPVVNNPFWQLPGINVLARMLHTTTVVTFLGIGFLVTGWLLLWRFALPRHAKRPVILPLRTYWRIFALWVIPLLGTAPLFTQDIYSYLAQGSIAAHGIDPYSAGPVDILGIQNPLARSVPLLWAHSPAPYGPVALGIGSLISTLTADGVILGVFAHRLVSIAGLALAGWALVRLAARCKVPPQTALWLGILNPLTLLHLVGGIHNEAYMLGLLLAGFELVLRGVDEHPRPVVSRWILISLGTIGITCAGLVKVTALMALGFAAVAVAHWLGGAWRHLVAAGAIIGTIASGAAIALSLATKVGFGWVFSQGGAAEIISWMSLSTLTALASAGLGMLLGLGDHLAAALAVFRTIGFLVGLFWLVRMLWAAYRGRIHPVGGLGVAMLFLVIFFPVVHPWYLLWAILPLAAWANRPGFHVAAVGYSVAFSFFILPRGLSLPPETVVFIYVMAAALFAGFLLVARAFARRHPRLQAALRA